MNRRDLIKQIAILTGAAVIGADLFLSGCKTSTAGKIVLNETNLKLLAEIAETIIPKTDTPGAKEAKVAEFMNTIVSDCYATTHQQAFTDGLKTLEEKCKKVNGKSFIDSDAKQRHDFLVTLEKEAKEFNIKVDDENKKARETAKQKSWKDDVDFVSTPRHYYTSIKQLTLWGYFSSKEGMTKALRYNPVPGKYDGSDPYIKGEKAWA